MRTTRPAAPAPPSDNSMLPPPPPPPGVDPAAPLDAPVLPLPPLADYVDCSLGYAAELPAWKELGNRRAKSNVAPSAVRPVQAA